MERALRSLDYLNYETNEHIREALFRDAVTSYAKPFSDNRGPHTRRALKISSKWIPRELRSAHKELVNLRNDLFAHIDLNRQKPIVEAYEMDGEQRIRFGVTGYERLCAGHLVEPLKCLANAFLSYLMEQLAAIAPHVLEELKRVKSHV